VLAGCIDALAVREIAGLLNVSHDSIFRWAAMGKLPPPLVIGGRMYWRVEQIPVLKATVAAFKVRKK